MIGERAERYEYYRLHQDSNGESVHGERSCRDILSERLYHTLAFVLVVGSTANSS